MDNAQVISVDKTWDSIRNVATKTNMGSMIGRSVAGGLLFGGVGAIVGGSTAKKDTIINYNQLVIKHC